MPIKKNSRISNASIRRTRKSASNKLSFEEVVARIRSMPEYNPVVRVTPCVIPPHLLKKCSSMISDVNEVSAVDPVQNDMVDLDMTPKKTIPTSFATPQRSPKRVSFVEPQSGEIHLPENAIEVSSDDEDTVAAPAPSEYGMAIGNKPNPSCMHHSVEAVECSPGQEQHEFTFSVKLAVSPNRSVSVAEVNVQPTSPAGDGVTAQLLTKPEKKHSTDDADGKDSGDEDVQHYMTGIRHHLHSAEKLFHNYLQTDKSSESQALYMTRFLDMLDAFRKVDELFSSPSCD